MTAQAERACFISMIRVDEKGDQAPSEQLMNDMGKLIEQ
jgi:hypothetical protein